MDRLEEDIFVLYQRLYHLPLVADVIQCCHGVEVWRTHQSGTEDDPQILCVHQVILLILCHPKHTPRYNGSELLYEARTNFYISVMIS